MIHKRLCLCFVYIVGFVLCSSVLALNATEIEAIRARTLQNKSPLRSGDAEAIERFFRSGLDEMILEEDPWEAVNVRNAIIVQGRGTEPSPYRTAFIDAAKKNLKSALDDIGTLPDADRRIRLELNLLIIAASLKSMDLAELGLGGLSSDNGTIRYWAVQTAANSDVARQLKSQVTGDEELAVRIVKALENIVVAATLPETLRSMAIFADELNTPESRGLLVKIADLRTKAYASWKVKYELMDSVLLSALGRQIALESSASEREKLCRTFGQLYSYVIERLILGERVLGAEQKWQLASVIVEVEHGVVSKLLGRSQVRLRKAVEDKKMSVLENERKFLLGSDTQAGQLAEKLVFDYGKNSGGDPVTGPKTLKAPVLPAGAGNE